MEKKISLVVPCFNEEEALPYFLKECLSVMKTIGCDYSIIFVNDGSSDETLELMKEFAFFHSHVEYISFSRNFGKEAAMYAGLCNADGDYVAVMDADMQDPPALLPKMLEILETGEYDCVATRREDRKGEPGVRSWFARRFYRLMDRISDSDMTDGARDFRLMTRRMTDAVTAMKESDRFSKGIFGWVGFRTYWLPYENTERVAGETKWSFGKLTRYALDGIVDFSRKPLDAVPAAGGIITLFGLFALIKLLVKQLAKGVATDPAWYVLCAVVIACGVQILFLGVLAQYIASMHRELKHRPHYIISETSISDAGRIG